MNAIAFRWYERLPRLLACVHRGHFGITWEQSYSDASKLQNLKYPGCRRANNTARHCAQDNRRSILTGNATSSIRALPSLV
eukprot:6187051-Pleurochrysis_carterae.AAC.1